MSERRSYEELAARVKELEALESRYRAQGAALREEEQHRKILFDASLDGIAIFNHKREVVEVNNRFAEMLGFTPREMVGSLAGGMNIRSRPSTCSRSSARPPGRPGQRSLPISTSSRSLPPAASRAADPR